VLIKWPAKKLDHPVGHCGMVCRPLAWYGRSRSVHVFNRNRGLRHLATAASISMVAGCGVFSSDSSNEGKPIVVGTTSEPSTLDPAASWDNS
jgi:peptide/nickel transport system substrate-binding protein